MIPNSRHCPWRSCLYFELDGTFPNHPANPLEPANLVDLQAAVREHQADIGLAFDGDADRCFVVDAAANPSRPRPAAAIVAEREIARAQTEGTGAPVVIHNLITSKAVPELVEASGGRGPHASGPPFIKAVMASEKAVFGGEHWRTTTSRISTTRTPNACSHARAFGRPLGEQQGTLSDLMERYDPYVASGGDQPEIEDKAVAVDRVRAHYAEQDPSVTVEDMDGTTFTHPGEGWWFNLRPSNTEPFLRA